MTENDDAGRYVEYLQAGLLAQGWSDVFDSKKVAEWYAKNRSRLRKLSAARGHEDSVIRLERLALEFEPSTRFEKFETAAIFEPKLERLRQAAHATGLKPVRPIRLATSTEITATALARPTSGEHILFIGPGTSAFCNYWAKAVTAVIKTVALVQPNQRVANCEELTAALKLAPASVVLAGRLALYYGTFGTAMGFGEVEQPKDYLDYRLALLDAIETWVVGHEYAHFLAHERIPDLDGQELEMFCDEMGLQLSRNCIYEGDFWLGFTGVGAIVFLRSFQLCEMVRDLLRKSSTAGVDSGKTLEYSASHPAIEDRIAAIKSNVVGKTVEDQRTSVENFVEEYDRILGCLGREVFETAVVAIREYDRSRSV